MNLDEILFVEEPIEYLERLHPLIRTVVERLKRGDWSFGHAGQHIGIGTSWCPSRPHHHHDEFCWPPTILELQAAGIDPKTFQIRKRG